jgi:hypothetical protein
MRPPIVSSGAANVVLTDEAAALARAQIESLPGVGILFLEKRGAQKDVVRTTEGEVSWQTLSEASWEAHVGSYTRYPREALERDGVNIKGILVFIDPRAHIASGTFVIGAAEGSFQVEHRERPQGAA